MPNPLLESEKEKQPPPPAPSFPFRLPPSTHSFHTYFTTTEQKTMKLSATALTGAIVGTAALVSFAAVPAEAAPSWSLSSLWNSAVGGTASTDDKGSFMTAGGTRRRRADGMDGGMDDGMGGMDGMDGMDGTDGMDGEDYYDYADLSPEEIAQLNGDDGDGMDMPDTDGMDGMGDMGDTDDGSDSDGTPNSYNGPEDDEEQTYAMVGVETSDDQGDDPVAAEEAAKQAAIEAMDEQEAADVEFEGDGAADLMEAEEEEQDHQNDENADDPSAGTINPDEVEKTDALAEDGESEAPALQDGVTIEALETGEVAEEVLSKLLNDTVKEEVFPEQAKLIEEAADKDEMPAAPEEEAKTEEELKNGVQADDEDEDDVVDVPDDGTEPTPEEEVPEGDSIKTTENAADQGLVTDGKPDVLANAENEGIDLEDLVANANAATDEAEAEEAPEEEATNHGPSPEDIQELMEELGTTDPDLSVTGMESEYAESFEEWDEQDDPDAPSDEVQYEQEQMDEMDASIDPSMFTTTDDETDEGETDVARRRRRAADATYTPV